MENTAKPVVEVIVEKNSVQVGNDPRNFVVSEKDWDLKQPVGVGETLEDAIDDFKSDWQLKRDEEIEVKVIETKIV
jgi:hypothetical protein